MVKIRLLAALLALSITVGCKAQSSATPKLDDATLARRVEILVRAQYNLPAEFDITIGARKASEINGYQTLPVTISNGVKSQTVDFLLSNDGQHFGRLQTVDLANNPQFHIDITDRPVRGNANAKVTVISFDDLECPFCARMHHTLFPATLKHYGDKVRFVYKDFPLLEIHPWAMRAAINADCLAAQNGEAYWSFVDYVHAHDEEVNGQEHDLAKSKATLDRLTREQSTRFNLDTAKLSACMTAQDETRVRASLKEGMELGIDGAPALFVNGERVNGGAQPQEVVWKVIDRALRAEGIEPPPAEAPANKTAPAKSN